MKNRLIIAGLLILALAIVAYFDNFWLNFAVFALLLSLSISEANNLFGLKEANFLIIIALIFFSFCVFLNPLYALLIMLISVSGALAFIKAQNPKLILPLIYPAAPIFALFALLQNCGMMTLVWLVVCVACSDTAAFFAGKYIKAKKPELLHPLSEASPNKSREGALAGLVAGTFFGLVFGLSIVDESFFLALGASFVASAFGILGDLFESYLKRLSGVKDSGALLGEHGGVLDRFDAIFFGAIAMLVVLV